MASHLKGERILRLYKKKKHPQLNFVNFLVFFFIYRTIEVFFIYKNYSVSQKELDPNF